MMMMMRMTQQFVSCHNHVSRHYKGTCVHSSTGFHTYAYEPRELGGCSRPQTRENPSFFGQKLHFSGKNRLPKMKKKFLYLLNKKTEFTLSNETMFEIRDFLLLITGWGESSKVILQVSLAVSK